MTVLWIAIGLISLVVAAVILGCHGRASRTAPQARAEFDLSVYKDQLAEVDRDVQRGVLGEEQASAARTEIERRILTLADAAERAATPSGRVQGDVTSPLAIGLALAVPSAALAIYATLGAPQIPNVPYAARDIPAETREAEERRQFQEMETLAERLAKRLEAEPDNVQGWMLLSRSYATMGRLENAVAAMKKAYALAPDDPNVLVQYAEVQISGENNAITESVRVLFEKAQAIDPRNARARYYLGLAKAQADDVHGAVQDWVDLIAISPGNAPWLATVRAQIAAASKELGVDPGSFKPSAAAQALASAGSAPGIPGPSREDVESAKQMSPEDRQEMIRGMVQRLADRLEENPDDPEGWRRLTRAYLVLGERTKAEYARNQEAKARDRLSSTGSGPGIPGPSREDVEAANRMSAQDRTAMIRGMVQRLADRLAENPNDAEGWRRLAGAYRVLGETAKAEDAEARAKAAEK